MTTNMISTKNVVHLRRFLRSKDSIHQFEKNFFQQEQTDFGETKIVVRSRTRRKRPMRKSRPTKDFIEWRVSNLIQMILILCNEQQIFFACQRICLIESVQSAELTNSLNVERQDIFLRDLNRSKISLFVVLFGLLDQGRDCSRVRIPESIVGIVGQEELVSFSWFDWLIVHLRFLVLVVLWPEGIDEVVGDESSDADSSKSNFSNKFVLRLSSNLSTRRVPIKMNSSFDGNNHRLNRRSPMEMLVHRRRCEEQCRYTSGTDHCQPSHSLSVYCSR